MTSVGYSLWRLGGYRNDRRWVRVRSADTIAELVAILDIARRHLSRAAAQEKQDKQDKPPADDPLVCFSCFSSPSATWDSRRACRQMEASDALVERLEVDGRHHEIADAASMVVSAYAVGRKAPTLRAYVKAAEVYLSIPDTSSDIRRSLADPEKEKTYHLEVVYGLPEPCWRTACEWLAGQADVSVKDVEFQVEKAKEYESNNADPKLAGAFQPSLPFAGGKP